jgi:molybdopterin synthase sulfur carrier subunit
MNIKLFGGLRQKAGGPVLNGSGSTIREVLESICDDNDSLREAIFDGNALRPHLRVMLNGHDCELVQGLETPVSAEDQIAVFPPIAGG